MNKEDIIKLRTEERENKNRWLEVNPYLTEESGIYILTRTDENGFKYAYVGQAKHILTRLAQHLKGYQHIDLSLKKHGLFDIHNNIYGWYVQYIPATEEELDEKEKTYIKHYADKGYQLRNKTAGGQSVGKVAIADNKPPKGYYDGKKQGRTDVIKELNKVIKYLQIQPQNDSKLAMRMAEKFWQIIGE